MRQKFQHTNVARQPLLLRLSGCLVLVCAWMLCLHNFCSAQYNNVWAMGRGAGLDFNGPVPQPIATAIDGTGEANASVCDHEGNLLFYTNGSFVWDAQHNLMPNGSDLTPYISTPATAPTSSSSQGALIVQIPGQPNKYYVFSLIEQLKPGEGELYYSVVDMDLNGGLGDVIAAQKGILLDFGLSERMIAVPGQQCNIWLLNVTINNQLKAREINAAGISPTTTNSQINTLNVSTPITGVISVSPDRSKIAISSSKDPLGPGSNSNGLVLLDFDAATGLVSNEIQIVPTSAYIYGTCFSPNGNLLYYNQAFGFMGVLMQVDISSGNASTIVSTATVIDYNVRNSHLKIGPDGKLYYKGGNQLPSPTGFSGYLCAVNLPDMPGMACQPQPNVITLLPGTTQYGLPAEAVILAPDTMTNTQLRNVCAGQTVELFPSRDGGWDFIWNDGSTAANRTVQDGLFWVSYKVPPCNYQIDTFLVEILPSATMELYDTICAYETYFFDEQYLSQTGRYSAVWPGANGCDSVVYLNLFVASGPTVIPASTELRVASGQPVQLRASGDGLSYYWSPPELVDDPFSASPIARVPITTTFTVSVTDAFGCSSSAQVLVIVDDNQIFIPNAFSPNGDGVNDRFELRGAQKQKLLAFEIYNRFGNLVFSGSGFSSYWDGTCNGKSCAAGTYYYLLRWTTEHGVMETVKGDIQLIR